MKPEEAIRVLNVAKAECEWNAPLEYQEAFNMAIEALKEQQEHSKNTMQNQPDLDKLSVKTGETCADAISRRAAIDAILADKIDDTSLKVMKAIDESDKALTLNNACDRHIREIEKLPSAQPPTCEECKHLGKWENEVEYGYPSPCTRCKRRVEDHYER